MKLIRQENIAQSEKAFIDTINAELDWEAIEKLLLEKHKFSLQEEIDYKDGNLIVYKDNIAYKFDFEIRVPLSVIFNREGECLEISTLRDDFKKEDEDPVMIKDEDAIPPDKNFMPVDKTGQMASNIADMISEINEGDE